MQHNLNTGGGRDEINNSVNAEGVFGDIICRAAVHAVQKRYLHD